ncbi:hypothetical protein [Nitriliruptor alkaliphilus]|uniref:hypothetical protein n=1 Tax=Nitriliruptor alkaliphilus TaxID=427918 RepID=UPI0012EDE3A0|nr:hypothetical protein [Nitriliruptor alkaliphilus]
MIGVPVGFAAAALTTAARDIDLTSPSSAGSPSPDGSQIRPDVEVEVPDLDGLDGTDAEVGAILVDINRSEEQMLATQQRFADVLADAADQAPAPGDIEGLLDQIGAAAGEGQRELQAIRRDLTDAAASDRDVRDLRDVYLTHLDSWVRYFVAVEADPTLFASGADEAFTLSINTTGDAFARVVREELPDDLDAEVRAFADQIVDRGFPERALSDDDTV